VTLLPPGALAQIQAIARSGMTGTATILTRITVETPDGQESHWATSGPDVPCWVHEITPDGKALGALSGAIDLIEVFQIRVPVGTAVTTGDRIAVGSTLYDVQHTNDQDTYPAWLSLACRASPEQ